MLGMDFRVRQRGVTCPHRIEEEDIRGVSCGDRDRSAAVDCFQLLDGRNARTAQAWERGVVEGRGAGAVTGQLPP